MKWDKKTFTSEQQHGSDSNWFENKFCGKTKASVNTIVSGFWTTKGSTKMPHEMQKELTGLIQKITSEQGNFVTVQANTLFTDLRNV